MSLTRAELLEVANVAYHNIVTTGIGQALAEADYTEERRLAGLQRAAALQAKRTEQQDAKGRQFVLTRQVKDALTACRSEMTALKQAVRTADRLAGSDLYTRLNLAGQTPRNYSGFVAFAKAVYEAIQADSGMLQALGGLGYTPTRLAELVQGIADLEALNRQQEMAKGDYQRLTQELQALEKAVRDDLMTLKAVVKTVFSGEAESQVLESLRLGRA